MESAGRLRAGSWSLRHAFFGEARRCHIGLPRRGAISICSSLFPTGSCATSESGDTTSSRQPGCQPVRARPTFYRKSRRSAEVRGKLSTRSVRLNASRCKRRRSLSNSRCPARGIAHQIVNRSNSDVLYLEIGDRTPGDGASYPSDDLQAELGSDAKWCFTRKDGTPYA
jgi:hypothetical protein